MNKLLGLLLLMPALAFAEVPYKTGTVSIDENFSYLSSQIKKNKGSSDKKISTITLSGDVTGPVNATIVGNDSHTHTINTLIGVEQDGASEAALAGKVSKTGDTMSGGLSSTAFYKTSSSMTAATGFFTGSTTTLLTTVIIGAGGTISTYDKDGITYAVHVFDVAGATDTFYAPEGVQTVRALVVGAGGNGGDGSRGGGGGAGGLIEREITISSNALQVTVGDHDTCGEVTASHVSSSFGGVSVYNGGIGGDSNLRVTGSSGANGGGGSNLGGGGSRAGGAGMFGGTRGGDGGDGTSTGPGGSGGGSYFRGQDLNEIGEYPWGSGTLSSITGVPLVYAGIAHNGHTSADRGNGGFSNVTGCNVVGQQGTVIISYPLQQYQKGVSLTVTGDAEVSHDIVAFNNITAANELKGNSANIIGTVTAAGFIGSGTEITGVVHTEVDPIFTSNVSSNITNANLLFLSTAQVAINLKLSSPTVDGENGHVLTYTDGLPTWQPASSAAGLTYVFTSSASDISGYSQMVSALNFVPSVRSTTTVTNPIVDQYFSSIATNVGYPGLTTIPSGSCFIHLHAQSSNNNRFKIKPEIYIRRGSVDYAYMETMEVSPFITTTETEYNLAGICPSTNTLITDRLVYKLKFAVVSPPGLGTITVYRDGKGTAVTSARLEMPSVAASVANFLPYNGAVKELNSAYGLNTSSDVTALNFHGMSSGTFAGQVAIGGYVSGTAKLRVLGDMYTSAGLLIGGSSRLYGLDVNSDGHFTSSLTVDGGYYGNGSTLTGVLTAPATFYIVRTTDYLTSPATFTFQTVGNYLTSPASFTYLANPATFTILTGSYLTAPASFTYLSNASVFLTAPATFYVVKTSDYLVSPATFTFQAVGNYLISPASFTYLANPATFTILTGAYLSSPATFYIVPTTAYLVAPASFTYLSNASAFLTAPATSYWVKSSDYLVAPASFTYAAQTHAHSYLTAPATFTILTGTYLVSPATFTIVKTSDYLVAPASFTYVANTSALLTGPATFYIVRTSEYLVAPASFTYLSNASAFLHSPATSYWVKTSDYLVAPASFTVVNPSHTHSYLTAPATFTILNSGSFLVAPASFTYAAQTHAHSYLNAPATFTILTGTYLTSPATFTLVTGAFVLKSGDSMSGSLAVSSLTVNGNARVIGDTFSVGGATLTVSAGKLLIGPGDVLYTIKEYLRVTSPDATLPSANGQLGLYSTDSYAIDKGGRIGFGGAYTGTTLTQWAVISGKKENSTDNNASGYLDFATRADGGSPTSKMRITSGGNVGIGTDNPATKLHLSSGTIRIDGNSTLSMTASGNIYSSGTISASNLLGTNTGDNATNSQYTSDYRAANFVAGTAYLAPNGSAASLTSFPTLNQNTTGNAAKSTLAQAAVSLSNEPSACAAGNYVTDISSMGVLTCGVPTGSGDVLKASTQTFTGGNTFIQSSTFTGTVNLPARDKILFVNELHNSSSTILTPYTSAQTVNHPCVTGSTLTVTTSGGRLMVGFSGAIDANTTGSSLKASFMYDGIPFDGQAALAAQYVNPAAITNLSFTALTPPLSAGVHSVCLILKTTTGSIYVYRDATWTSQFWVQELR